MKTILDIEIQKVNLKEILDSREFRASKQRQLISKFKLPLISAKLNIPGEIKNSPLISITMKYAGSILSDQFKNNIKYFEKSYPKKGPEIN